MHKKPRKMSCLSGFQTCDGFSCCWFGVFFFHDAVMFSSEHDRIHESYSQCLGDFKLWIHSIHRTLYYLFSTFLLHSPLWHIFLIASHFSSWKAFIARIFYPYLFEQKKHTLHLLPREKENHWCEKNVSKELQSLTAYKSCKTENNYLAWRSKSRQ